MAKTAKTNAARLLDAAGIDYEVRTYDLSMDEFSATAVAAEVGMPAAAVFKTLVVEIERSGPVFAVVPADTELDLKALAAAAGGRKATMAHLRDVLRMTGYPRGAVTVLGAKKAFPVIVDESATGLERMAVSGGARGVQLVLAPADYLALTGAKPSPIGRRAAPSE
jgi:Cys-tRNA(Pro)/Cys-tRNA(Cys) deacylase